MWLFLSLLSAVFFGLSTYFFKKGFKNISIWQSMWLESIVTMVFTVPYVLIRGNLVWNDLGIVFLLGIVIIVVYYFYLMAFHKNYLSITSSVVSLAPIFIAIFAYFFIGQSISLWGGLIIGLIVFGVTLVGFDFTDIKSFKDLKKARIERALLWGGIGMIASTIMDLAAGKIFTFSTPSTYLLILIPAEALVALIVLLIKKEKINIFKNHQSKLKDTIYGASFMSLGTFTYFEAIAIGKVAYVSAAASFSVVLSLLLGVLFMQEKLRKVQFIGIIVVVIGSMLFVLI